MSNQSMNFSLHFDIQSFWHIGSGLDGGAYADALALKDVSGLPFIPGKSIKGLLKEAFVQANENQWFPAKEGRELIALLFGNEGTSGNDEQGIIQLTNASLHSNEMTYFTETPHAKISLYDVIYSTAIDDKSGVAKETSLRSLEVVVPMQLIATVSLNTHHPLYALPENEIGEQFSKWLALALPLISKLGAKRHRGLGQVIVTSNVLNTSTAGKK
jgi:CRISPR/Cas system CSM-associated protein Csm3 (group 7 of RAMP superfamily)